MEILLSKFYHYILSAIVQQIEKSIFSTGKLYFFVTNGHDEWNERSIAVRRSRIYIFIDTRSFIIFRIRAFLDCREEEEEGSE